MAGDIKVKVNLKEIEDLSKRYPEASKTARQGRLTEALLLLEREVKRLTPEGAGPIHLRDTIFQKVEMYGESAWGQVGTPAIYGESVEYGTKPHFPPIAPLIFWVEKRLGLSGKEAKSVAFAIARKISKKGTYGTHMFQYGFERNRAQIIAMLRQIPEDIVKAVSA